MSADAIVVCTACGCGVHTFAAPDPHRDTRDPSQALSVAGSFVGGANDFDRMDVSVEVAAETMAEAA